MDNIEELLIAETNEIEFKVALEVSKPKSWLKTVCAFGNCLKLHHLKSIKKLY